MNYNEYYYDQRYFLFTYVIFSHLQLPFFYIYKSICTHIIYSQFTMKLNYHSHKHDVYIKYSISRHLHQLYHVVMIHPFTWVNCLSLPCLVGVICFSKLIFLSNFFLLCSMFVIYSHKPEKIHLFTLVIWSEQVFRNRRKSTTNFCL